jgi:hypothetical protein
MDELKKVNLTLEALMERKFDEHYDSPHSST